MYAAIDMVLSCKDLSTLQLTTDRVAHMETQPGVGLAAVAVTPGPEVLDFPVPPDSALAPYTASGGDADAYVRTVAEPDSNDATISYIENYAPDHSGEHYLAHVAVGVANVSDLETFEAEQLPPLTFAGGGISIYQLGNNGTAARHLKSWTAT